MEKIEAKQFVESILAEFIGKDMSSYHIQMSFAEKFQYCIAGMYSQRDYAIHSNLNPYVYVVGVDVVSFEDEYGNTGSQLEFIYTNHLQSSMRHRYNV